MEHTVVSSIILTNEDSPQKATGYQKEVDSELAEETKQASGNPPIEIEVQLKPSCHLRHTSSIAL